VYHVSFNANLPVGRDRFSSTTLRESLSKTPIEMEFETTDKGRVSKVPCSVQETIKTMPLLLLLRTFFVIWNLIVAVPVLLLMIGWFVTVRAPRMPLGVSRIAVSEIFFLEERSRSQS